MTDRARVQSIDIPGELRAAVGSCIDPGQQVADA
jgi:hypothetical protein